MDSGLDNRMRVGRPLGCRGSQERKEGTLPASPHSNMEDLGATNSNLRPGLEVVSKVFTLSDLEVAGSLAQVGGYDTSFNST